MNGLAPFAHGYVYLQKGRIKACTAMMFAMETSKGVINPGVYKANTKVKVVFKDDGRREGSVRDMFCLPQSELTKKQIAKSPLFVSDIDWREPKPPVYPKNKALAKELPAVLETLRTFFLGVNKSPRNRARLRSVDFKVNVITGSGEFAIVAKSGAIKLLEKPLPKADATLAIKDPACFEGWAQGKALTNLFALGDLWLSNRLGVRLLEDLDRLWRAAHRDGTL
jgi:hypothetical protein